MNWTAENTRALFHSGPCERPLLQAPWDWLRVRETWLRSPFFPAAFSFITYLTFCSPFLALDLLQRRLPALKKYKIQPRATLSAATLLACLARSIYDHLVCIFPATVAHWYWRPMSLPERAPELPRLLLDIVVGLLLFDFCNFLWHLLHHRVPWLYKTFHKAHHKHIASFALSTQDSSMWELMWLGCFAAGISMLLKCHPMTEMAFFMVNSWLSVEDHSGYDLPWSTHRLVPFGLYGGALHHDLHHLKVNVNYAPYFTHWDRLFGTLGQAVEKRQAPAKLNRD